MKKRGQLMEQPFIMLFAIIVGFLILTWGTWQVYKLMNLSEEIEIKKNMNEFQKVVDQYYYFDEGSSVSYKIKVPSKFNKICFYDRDRSWTPSDIDLNEGFIKERGDNVFIFPLDKDSTFDIGNLKVKIGEDNPLCFKTYEKFLLVSQGTHVEVSPS